MKSLAQAFRTQAEIIKKEEQEKEKEMSFSIKAKCQHGELIHRRKTAEAALRKAREMSRAGCYDITSPRPRDGFPLRPNSSTCPVRPLQSGRSGNRIQRTADTR